MSNVIKFSVKTKDGKPCFKGGMRLHNNQTMSFSEDVVAKTPWIGILKDQGVLVPLGETGKPLNKQSSASKPKTSYSSKKKSPKVEKAPEVEKLEEVVTPSAEVVVETPEVVEASVEIPKESSEE